MKYVRLASEIDYRVQPPHDPVQINDVKEITPGIIMNTIMAVRDKLRVDWITALENKTIMYIKVEQEQISELTRTDESVQKQLLEIKKTLQTLSQVVPNTKGSHHILYTGCLLPTTPKRSYWGPHTMNLLPQGTYYSKTQNPEPPVNPKSIPPTGTIPPNPAHNPYINHDCHCQHYPPDRHPTKRYTQWSNPYSPPDIYCNNSYSLNKFTKSSIPTKLNTDKGDPGKADLKA